MNIDGWGRRFSDAAIQRKRIGLGASSSDPSTASLLHMDGANGGSSFIDTTGKIWTPVNAVTSTTQSVFGGASGYFDGTGDYISTPHHADFDFGSGDFTIELWMLRHNTLTANDILFSIYDDADNRMQFNIGSPGTIIQFFCNSGGSTIANYLTSAPYTFGTTTWDHIAFVRNGANYYIFIAGVSRALTKTVDLGAGALPTLTGIITVGARYTGSVDRDIPAYIDEFRVSKGVARWTADFIPPTAAY